MAPRPDPVGVIGQVFRPWSAESKVSKRSRPHATTAAFAALRSPGHALANRLCIPRRSNVYICRRVLFHGFARNSDGLIHLRPLIRSRTSTSHPNLTRPHPPPNSRKNCVLGARLWGLCSVGSRPSTSVGRGWTVGSCQPRILAADCADPSTMGILLPDHTLRRATYLTRCFGRRVRKTCPIAPTGPVRGGAAKDPGGLGGMGGGNLLVIGGKWRGSHATPPARASRVPAQAFSAARRPASSPLDRLRSGGCQPADPQATPVMTVRRFWLMPLDRTCLTYPPASPVNTNVRRYRLRQITQPARPLTETPILLRLEPSSLLRAMWLPTVSVRGKESNLRWKRSTAMVALTASP